MRKLLKMVSVGILVLLLMTAAAQAAELNGLIGAGAGYLSSVDYVAVAFNAYAGEDMVFMGLPLQYSNTVGLCALSSYTALGAILAYGDTSIRRVMTMPMDDFYVYLCLGLSGYPGNFAIVAADYHGFTGQAVGEMSTRAAADVSDDLRAKLQEKLSEAFKRISGN